MNEKPTEKVVKLPIITKFCMTIGELPTSYLMSLTYLEQVTWLCNFLEKTMIPALNQNGEAVEELQSLYELLRTYVNDYFDNLDVQEEINNKLDEMVESGQLEEIIAQYLGLAGMIVFDNVADMKQATNLVDGSKCQTLGYHSINDGGKAIYKIRNITNNDNVDEGSIIALNDNTLIAELVTNEIKPEMFGAYSDGTHKTETTTAFENMFNYVYSKQVTYDNETIAPEVNLYGTYTIDNITITNDLAIIRIIGHKAKIYDGGFIINTTSGWKVLISGITFQNCNNPILMQYRNLEYGRYEIKDCIFKLCTGKAIEIHRRSCQTIIENNTFRACENDVYVEDSDMFIFRKNWLECATLWEDNHSAVYHYCPNEGSAIIEENMFIPGFSQTNLNPCWVRVGRNANILNNRFSGENTTINAVRIEYDAIASWNWNASIYPLINFCNNPIVAGKYPILLGDFKGRINYINNSGFTNGSKLIYVFPTSETYYNELNTRDLYIHIENNAGRTVNFRNGEYNSIGAGQKPTIPEILQKFIQNKPMFAGNYNPTYNITTSNNNHTITIDFNDKSLIKSYHYVALVGTLNKNPGGSGNYNDNFIILVSIRGYYDNGIRFKPAIKIISDTTTTFTFDATINGQEYLTAAPTDDTVKIEITATSPAVATFTSYEVLEFTPFANVFSN